MDKKFIYYYTSNDVERLEGSIELRRCYGYSDVYNEGSICVESPSEEMLNNIQNYIYLDGALVYDKQIGKSTFEEVQTDYNIDIDYRLSCIELGISKEE